jgi:hypothetical protein
MHSLSAGHPPSEGCPGAEKPEGGLHDPEDGWGAVSAPAGRAPGPSSAWAWRSCRRPSATAAEGRPSWTARPVVPVAAESPPEDAAPATEAAEAEPWDRGGRGLAGRPPEAAGLAAWGSGP